MINLLSLILCIVAIVVISMAFCNAIEHLGQWLHLSDGVTGSIFAATATALPETVIPLIALFTNKVPNNTNIEIGVASIIGAPLMLSTLSVFIMSISISMKRGVFGKIMANMEALTRDLKFFLFAYVILVIALVVNFYKQFWVFNLVMALLLGAIYIKYVLVTLKDATNNDGVTNAEDRLYLEILGFKKNMITILIQLILMLVVLIYVANIFIEILKHISANYEISAFMVALIIVPIATELPEKTNSIIWLLKGRDTLALANITGAMVFQGTLLPMIVLLSGNFAGLDLKIIIINILITLIATIWIYLKAKSNNGLRVWHLLVNGLFYFINLAICYGYINR